jgi:hypothetical protein
VTEQRSWTEEIRVEAGQLVDTIKGLVHEGNVRHIVIRNPDGRTVLDLPLSAGIVGAALVPVFAGIASIAAYAARYTVVVERTEPKPPATTV